ncbi:MAG: hypothetical protein L3J35_02610 [Bacteroidales bacterium]|nr:hypothetical protein [Bacteroidales bacterium]
MKKISFLFLTTLFFLFAGFVAQSQSEVNSKTGGEDNPRLQNRFGINFLIGSPAYVLSFSADYFIKPYLNAEIGAGIAGYYGGVKYYLFGNTNKNWTPYTGLYAASVPVIRLFEETTERRLHLYSPVGIQYSGDRGFTFAIEAAATYSVKRDSPFLPWGAIRLGFHF